MAYRILVVEDEPDTRDLLEFTLRWAGYDVDSVVSGHEGLVLLSGYSYDVILTDVHMPGMSGEEFYRRLEHGWPHLASRVVFVTAGRSSDGFQAYIEGRPVPTLTKPYTHQRLLGVIEDVVARDS